MIGPEARWPDNFRDLAASVTRVATFSPKGPIFTTSRWQRSSTNNADRLCKYLGRFGLSWAQVAQH